MTKDDVQSLAKGVGMVRTESDLIKPLWTASDSQLQKMIEIVIQDVKQSASEIMVKAIKKAVAYERAECAKLAGYVSPEAAKSIREREDD